MFGMRVLKFTFLALIALSMTAILMMFTIAPTLPTELSASGTSIFALSSAVMLGIVGYLVAAFTRLVSED